MDLLYQICSGISVKYVYYNLFNIYLQNLEYWAKVSYTKCELHCWLVIQSGLSAPVCVVCLLACMSATSNCSYQVQLGEYISV